MESRILPSFDDSWVLGPTVQHLVFQQSQPQVASADDFFARHPFLAVDPPPPLYPPPAPTPLPSSLGAAPPERPVSFVDSRERRPPAAYPSNAYAQKPPAAYPGDAYSHRAGSAFDSRAQKSANAFEPTPGSSSQRTAAPVGSAYPGDSRSQSSRPSPAPYDDSARLAEQRRPPGPEPTRDNGKGRAGAFHVASAAWRFSEQHDSRGGPSGGGRANYGHGNGRQGGQKGGDWDQPEEENAPPSQASKILKRKFAIPQSLDQQQGGSGRGAAPAASTSGSGYRPLGKQSRSDAKDDKKDEAVELPEKLRGCDPKLIEMIENEIVDRGQPVTFDDIAGLAEAKQGVYELVCWPMKRPELFTGLRSLPKGLLLFGPPGTGKTLIGKAIAYESGATFFSISASSLMSKWTGESERLVKTLFAVASYREPSVVFVDEVDSLLTQRSSEENEASRRLKTEFLVQLDGAATPTDRVLVVGATNRPHELDEAARRRFVKKLYIPLPEESGRRDLVVGLLRKNTNSLDRSNVEEIVASTVGFSGADLRSLCQEAAMGPIRESVSSISRIDEADLPPISFKHFASALRSIRPSVAQKDLDLYVKWNNEFGTFARAE